MFAGGQPHDLRQAIPTDCAASKNRKSSGVLELRIFLLQTENLESDVFSRIIWELYLGNHQNAGISVKIIRFLFSRSQINGNTWRGYGIEVQGAWASDRNLIIFHGNARSILVVSFHSCNSSRYKMGIREIYAAHKCSAACILWLYCPPQQNPISAPDSSLFTFQVF